MKLLNSVLNQAKDILIPIIPNNPNEAVCFKITIDIEGLVVGYVGLLAVSADPRCEALNIWPSQIR